MQPLWLDLEPESGIRAVPLPWAWHHHQLQSLRHQILAANNGHLSHPPPSPPGLPSQAQDWRPRQAPPTPLPWPTPPSLAEIDAALGRIRHGTYGLCEETGQPIPPELLLAAPWLHRCPVSAPPTPSPLRQTPAHLNP